MLSPTTIALILFVFVSIIVAILHFRLRAGSPLDLGSTDYEKTTNVDDFEVFYQDLGSGPPILLLHGIGASSHTWRYQLKELSKTHRVIIPDLPGFGRSSHLIDKAYRREEQTHRIAEFLKKLDISSCVVIGSSMGGTLGISLAADYPGLVKSLILLAPATEPSLVPKGLYTAGWSSGIVHTFVNRTLIKTIIKRVNANMDNISDADIDIYYEPYKNKDAVRTFIKSLKTIRDKNIESIIKLVKVPTLILYGQKDNMVPDWAMTKLNQQLPNSRMLVHSKAGHHLQEDDFEWTNQRILDFLD